MACAGLVPMVVGCAIDLAKFGIPFGIPLSDQILYRIMGYQHYNSGQYFSMRYLPSTLQAYVDPSNFQFSSLFPYIRLPDAPGEIAHTALFARAPTASALVSMPLLVAAGVWGVITAFSPQLPRGLRGLRILLVTSALTAGSVLVFGWIYERFTADFMPLLILASTVGMIDIWRRMAGRSAAKRRGVVASVAFLALFGFWANMGFAITPEDNWSQTQLTNYLSVQQTFSDYTGHPLDNYVVTGSAFPTGSRWGTLFIKGRCQKLYLADIAEPLNPYAAYVYTQIFWPLVERAPHTPLCRSLIGHGRPEPSSRTGHRQ
jgi:hypothetical protein